MSNLLATGISKRVQLNYRFAEEPVVVEAEATQIRQVLMNLITNASDAMNQQSGIITLTTGLVEATAADFEGLPWARELRSGSYAFFEVADQGCGMTPETVRRMFEPFYTTKPHGRGLGLAAVQDIVRSHHGALRVRSSPGAGTSIRVLLPLPLEIAFLPSNDAQIQSDWRGSGILLVADDDKMARDTAATLLAHLGFEVLQAADGDEAVRCFHRSPRPICGILLDATIPGLEGHEVARQLRISRPDLPVLLTSGYDEGEATRNYADVPVNGFVQKPFELCHLRNALKEFLPEDVSARDEPRSPNSASAWTQKPVWAGEIL
jgi:CheY-like chemotaxis protein